MPKKRPGGCPGQSNREGFWAGAGNQPVAARVCHQKPGVAGIWLDLLPQTVDMGFQRVGGDAGVIAPDLVQQHVAGDDTVLRAIEELQDIGLFLGQADFFLVLVDQHLGRGLERVGADGEDGVLTLLVLAQLCAHTGKKHRELEGFRHVIVRARIEV